LRLIIDVLKVILDELYGLAVEQVSDALHPEAITSRVDDFTAAISSVKIVGQYRVQERKGEQIERATGATAELKIYQGDSGISGGAMSSASNSSIRESQTEIVGESRIHIEFGRIQVSLRSLLAVLGNPKIWVLIDEWSEIPIELQPYLADLLRRTLLPIDNFVVKIAAIEHRTRFSIPKADREYLGLELGADISADLNLDDFLVFENDQNKSVSFFRNLLFRHYQATAAGAEIANSRELVRAVFTQSPVFEEFVRAVEGVPRDALNLATKTATRSFGKPVAMNDVRIAARDWYQNDKASIILADEKLGNILRFIVDTVIGERRARAFLFPSHVRNVYIESLFDARLLHILKKNISSHDEPGERFDVFKIDYGCYVDLINTQKAPQGLFEVNEQAFVEVPVDDYRSIRRAILRPEDLQRALDG